MTRHGAARWASLLLSVVVIAEVTLIPYSGIATTPFFCFNCGSWLQDGFDNVLLFAPFGLACAMLGSRPLRAAGASLAFSCAIEALQFSSIAGRDSAAADLVANTLGGWLGALTLHRRLWWPNHDVARRIALPAAVVYGLGLGAAGHWFSPRAPEGPLFPSFDPALGPLPSPTRVLKATWNGRSLQCCPDPDWRRMQRDLGSGAVEFHIRALLLETPRHTGRVMTVLDDREVPVAVVGVNGRGAWGAFATVGQTSGSGNFGVFAPAIDAWKSGDTIDVLLRAERGMWSIRVTHGGTTSDGVVRQSPVLAGYYFLPGFGMAHEPLPFWRWLASQLPVVIVALWSARSDRRRTPYASAALLVGTTVLVGMPWVFPSVLLIALAWMLGTFALVATITTQVSRRTSRPAADRGSAR